MTNFTFQLISQCGHARLGVVDTPRGKIRTPAFMPVGTVGTVKGLYPEQVKATGADILLGQYLSPDAAAGGRAHGAARRSAFLHALGRADPDRLAAASR